MKTSKKRAMRVRLSEAQNHRCCYCGCDIRDGATLERVIPGCRGGHYVWANLVVACYPCNGGMIYSGTIRIGAHPLTLSHVYRLVSAALRSGHDDAPLVPYEYFLPLAA